MPGARTPRPISAPPPPPTCGHSSKEPASAAQQQLSGQSGSCASRCTIRGGIRPPSGDSAAGWLLPRSGRFVSYRLVKFCAHCLLVGLRALHHCLSVCLCACVPVCGKFYLASIACAPSYRLSRTSPLFLLCRERSVLCRAEVKVTFAFLHLAAW
jgi:hypothetical protein